MRHSKDCRLRAYSRGNGGSPKDVGAPAMLAVHSDGSREKPWVEAVVALLYCSLKFCCCWSVILTRVADIRERCSMILKLLAPHKILF